MPALENQPNGTMAKAPRPLFFGLHILRWLALWKPKTRYFGRPVAGNAGDFAGNAASQLQAKLRMTRGPIFAPLTSFSFRKIQAMGSGFWTKRVGLIKGKSVAGSAGDVVGTAER